MADNGGANNENGGANNENEEVFDWNAVFPHLEYDVWHAIAFIQDPARLDEAIAAYQAQAQAQMVNADAQPQPQPQPQPPQQQQPVDDPNDPDFVGPQNIDVPPRSPREVRNRQPPARFGDFVLGDEEDDDD